MCVELDSVIIIPRGGYRMANRQSVEAFQWLAYIGREWEGSLFGLGT